MTKIGATLREMRIAKGLTLEEAAARSGMAHTSLSRYENDKQNWTGEGLEKIAKVYGVDVADIFIRAAQVEDGPEIKSSVPLIDWVQAGMWNKAADPLPPGQGERIPTTYRARPNTYALRVRGDSMEPKFPEGAIIIVEPGEAPVNGSYVIVRQNHDDATFKQLVKDGYRAYLKPLNPRYPVIEMAPDAVICGVVKRVEMDV